MNQIQTVSDIDRYLPNAILVSVDYDVLSTLCAIGYLPSELETNSDWLDSEEWLSNDYDTLFVVLDESGADYARVYGCSGVPYLTKGIDLIWDNYNLLIKQ